MKFPRRTEDGPRKCPSNDEAREDRLWQPCLKGGPTAEAEADAFLERQVSFDSDIWIVAVEDRAGRHFLNDWLVPS